ncbi:hypothetical protein EAG_02165 [Camponotus floridanus]|uniref:Uncharacterized protein n=1 Tax=Camponotus floridanus TaxID=104421 RepID=E2A022_CAMFO|nr:hypothetical protein EAG_02165 [Camponotus floridanus]
MRGSTVGAGIPPTGMEHVSSEEEAHRELERMRTQHGNILVGDLNIERRREDPDRNRTGSALGAESITTATLWRSPEDFPNPEEVRRGKGRLLPRLFLFAAENFRGPYGGITAVIRIGPRRVRHGPAPIRFGEEKFGGKRSPTCLPRTSRSSCLADEQPIRT